MKLKLKSSICDIMFTFHIQIRSEICDRWCNSINSYSTSFLTLHGTLWYSLTFYRTFWGPYFCCIWSNLFSCIPEIGKGWAPAVINSPSELFLIQKIQKIMNDSYNYWIGGSTYAKHGKPVVFHDYFATEIG